MLRYYIEIPADNADKKLSAELKTEEPLTDLELQEAVIEFAQEEGVCPSWALLNCMHKVETVAN